MRVRDCPNHISYKVVITDKNMPIMNGIEEAKKIRQLQEKGDISRQLKVVLLSGYQNNKEF